MIASLSVRWCRSGPGVQAAAAVALVLLGGESLHAQQSASDAQNPGELQEVVVTAQRRSEDIQKIPLAITAVSSEAIANQGITDPVGLQDLVPSLNIVQRGGTGTNISVRGLVSNTTAPQGGPSVSVNVDDIFVARTQATDANFFDVDRIEVLRGPQGTLYGKNSTAGAVNIITNNPTQKLRRERLGGSRRLRISHHQWHGESADQ